MLEGASVLPSLGLPPGSVAFGNDDTSNKSAGKNSNSSSIDCSGSSMSARRSYIKANKSSNSATDADNKKHINNKQNNYTITKTATDNARTRTNVYTC